MRECWGWRDQKPFSNNKVEEAAFFLKLWLEFPINWVQAQWERIHFYQVEGLMAVRITIFRNQSGTRSTSLQIKSPFSFTDFPPNCFHLKLPQVPQLTSMSSWYWVYPPASGRPSASPLSSSVSPVPSVAAWGTACSFLCWPWLTLVTSLGGELGIFSDFPALCFFFCKKWSHNTHLQLWVYS